MCNPHLAPQVTLEALFLWHLQGYNEMNFTLFEAEMSLMLFAFGLLPSEV